MKKVALVGDYRESVTAHRAIPRALELASDALQTEVGWEWMHSRTLTDPPTELRSFGGIWVVPGSPYENTSAVLAAIRFARATGRPFLGTCGGFQHALMEYADAVWGVKAAHAETEPDATDPVVAPLVCALLEARGTLHFERGSRLERIYESETATEEYHCSYGLNPLYAKRFEDGPLEVAARDDEGSIRAFALTTHPFFIGTLFQPERAALRDRLPPLVQAFVAAVR